MKPIYLRSLLVVFSVLTSAIYSIGQTTVTLPTIPCATCNGPGSFTTSAPTCITGLVGAPLTMSWGAATGATSYTVMIATDANLSQNVATTTLTGTSLSLPAIALAPSVTYYWTVFANSAAGSTKATGGPCTFSTNTTWTGSSTTKGFPNGSLSQQMFNNGVAGGYSTCQSGDGTCASGDNLICNPKFEAINSYTPNWITHYGGYATPGGAASTGTVSLGSAGPSTGASTAISLLSSAQAAQPLHLENSTAASVAYRVSFWGKYLAASSGAQLFVGLSPNGNSLTGNFQAASLSTYYVTTTLSANWTQYILTIQVPAGASTNDFFLGSNGYQAYLTDVTLCKL